MATLSKEDTINVIFGVFMILLAVVTIVQAARTPSLGPADHTVDQDQGTSNLPDNLQYQDANVSF